MIQKLENDIRKHIRCEAQLKLHIEALEEVCEKMERECRKSADMISKSTNRILFLEEENQRIKKLDAENQKKLQVKIWKLEQKGKVARSDKAVQTDGKQQKSSVLNESNWTMGSREFKEH